MKRLLLHSFLLVFTLLIIGYSILYFLFPRALLLDLHFTVPAIESISSFLGLIPQSAIYDTTKLDKKRIQANLAGMLRQTTSPTQVMIQTGATEQFALRDLPANNRLYSPVFTFVGDLSDDATQILIYFENDHQHISKELFVDDFTPGKQTFSHTVGVHRESMFEGTNVYVIEVVFRSGEKRTRTVSLSVDYERLDIGEMSLYIDPYMIPPDAQDDLIWTVKDFAGNDTQFITYGCEISSTKPPLLIKDNVDYHLVPACLSFSLLKPYLLVYRYEAIRGAEFLFTIDGLSAGIIKKSVPLYHQYFGKIFYSLLFFDPLLDELTMVRSRGDTQKNDFEISITQRVTGQESLLVKLLGGTQLEVNTPTEKMLFYLYKELDLKTSLIHPGSRYQYFRKGVADRRTKIYEAQPYTLPIRILAPGNGYDPTFSFDVSFQDDLVQVDDGLRRIQFKTKQMLRTLSVSELPRASQCDQIKIGVYNTTMKGDLEKTYSRRNPYLLVASGLPTDQVMIYHQDDLEGIIPDQIYGGYLSHRIRYPNGHMDVGQNTYTIVARDQYHHVICRAVYTIEVL